MLNISAGFTKSASKALLQAQLCAAAMGSQRMSSGHLLLGLARGGDELTRCIIGDIEVRAREEAVLSRCGHGDAGFTRVTGMTPHVQRILLRAIAYVSPEKKTLAGVAHIWQELLCETGCTALEVLHELGKGEELLRTALVNAVGEIERPLAARRIAPSDAPITQEEVAAARQAAPKEAPTQDKNPLSLYARNLTQAAMEGRLEPMIGRREELAAMKAVVTEASQQENAILFIDEIHTLVGAGGSEGSLDAANILKPALARGEVRVIGATTYKEYQKYIEKDAALARRFQRIDVAEPDKAQTRAILSGLKPRYEAFHRVAIGEEALDAAVELSARYVTDRFMPDKAIDLLDEAASMRKLEVQQDTGTDAPSPRLGAADVAKVVSQWTGIPVGRMDTGDNADVLGLEEKLRRRIVGQDEAISALCRALRRARAGLNDPGRPFGVFMLLGPSGVGKTELCRALSDALFGSEDALIRIDMSEYAEEATASRLIGSPPGYVGFGDGGQLTDAVIKRPYSVVLFDEIEKAHPKIFSLLLQLLDDGRLTDSVGRRVSFRNTVVVMTSNAGVSFDMNKRLGFAGAGTDSGAESRRKTILEKTKQTFRPEFLGRIDELIVMNSLTQADGERIAALLLGRTAQRLAARGVLLEFDDDAAALLAQEGMDPMSGARNLRRLIARRVEEPLSDMLLEGTLGERVRLCVQDGALHFACESSVPGEETALAADTDEAAMQSHRAFMP